MSDSEAVPEGERDERMTMDDQLRNDALTPNQQTMVAHLFDRLATAEARADRYEKALEVIVGNGETHHHSPTTVVNIARVALHPGEET